MKKCGRCHEVKADEFFSNNKSTKDGLAWDCKVCKAKHKKSSYSHEAEIRRVFNLTPTDYAGMLARQDSKCAICKRPEQVLNTRTGEVRRLAVDHCHTTGKVRGLLCFRCNRAVGLMNDNAEYLNSASAYLTAYK